MKLTNKEMAHEMGNAIAVQEGLLELLEVEGLTDRQENLVNKLHRSVKLMGKMSKELAADELAELPEYQHSKNRNKNHNKNCAAQGIELDEAENAEEKCNEKDRIKDGGELCSDEEKAGGGVEKQREGAEAETAAGKHSERCRQPVFPDTAAEKHSNNEEKEKSVGTRAENFCEFMEDICESLRGFADKKHLFFSYASEVPEKALLKFDSDTAYQVLTNLVSNAAKYTGNGSIAVRSYLKESVTSRTVEDAKAVEKNDGSKIKLTNVHAHFEEAAKIARSLENKVKNYGHAKSKVKEDGITQKNVPEKAVIELIFEVKDTGRGIAGKYKEAIFLPEVRLMPEISVINVTIREDDSETARSYSRYNRKNLVPGGSGLYKLEPDPSGSGLYKLKPGSIGSGLCKGKPDPGGSGLYKLEPDPSGGRLSKGKPETSNNVMCKETVDLDGRGMYKEDTDPGGSGQGLAICKCLLAAAGGNIWLESSPGKGSTFTFSLPVSDVRFRENDFAKSTSILTD